MRKFSKSIGADSGNILGDSPVSYGLAFPTGLNQRFLENRYKNRTDRNLDFQDKSRACLSYSVVQGAAMNAGGGLASKGFAAFPVIRNPNFFYIPAFLIPPCYLKQTEAHL